jgi:flagellar biosynthesis protein FlhA
LPSWVLDILISVNISLSIVVLLVALTLKSAVELRVFPTLLLLLTLFRLALNISSSRLILLNGSTGTNAAGDVIEAFGGFVVGGNYVVGVVMFLVLIAIQYVVINHGAVRISEVTARFTLDALPGKQMSIDSDLNAGLINETEARARRKALAAEAEFYGAMDGATRFTQRDAVASILITVINIAAGMLVGIVQHGMSAQEALTTYTVLTIGDGLVTVVPALMISISGGLIVTRATSDSEMSEDVAKQLFGSTSPLFLASIVMFLLAITPGMPKVPFLVLAGSVGMFANHLKKRSSAQAAAAPPKAPTNQKEDIDSLLRVEPVALELGLGLIRFADGGQASPLLRRIAGMRRQIASDLGFVIPPVRVTDSLSLGALEYVITLRGAEASRFTLAPSSVLLIPAPGKPLPQGGRATKEPAFGFDAFWVPEVEAERARLAGHTVVDPLSVICTHLAEVLRRNAHELLSRQDTKRFLDRVAEEHPRVVEDSVPKLLSLACLQRVLQNLLRERVPVRDGSRILESLGEAAAICKNPTLLTEVVRRALARSIVKPHLTADGTLTVLFVDSALENLIEHAVEHQEVTSYCNLGPQDVRSIVDAVRTASGRHGTNFVILTNGNLRFFLRQYIEAQCPNITVISHGEVPAGVRIVSLGTIGGSE